MKADSSWSLMFLCSHALRHDGAGHWFSPKGQRRRKVVTMRSSNAVEIVLRLYGVHWYKTNCCKYFQFLSYLDTLGLWKPQLMLFSQRCYLPRVDIRHNHPFPLRLLRVDIVIFFSRPVNLNDCCPLVGLHNKWVLHPCDDWQGKTSCSAAEGNMRKFFSALSFRGTPTNFGACVSSVKD